MPHPSCEVESASWSFRRSLLELSFIGEEDPLSPSSISVTVAVSPCEAPVADTGGVAGTFLSYEAAADCFVQLLSAEASAQVEASLRNRLIIKNAPGQPLSLIHI